MIVLAVPTRVSDQQEKARRRRAPVVKGVIDEVADGAGIGDATAPLVVDVADVDFGHRETLAAAQRHERRGRLAQARMGDEQIVGLPVGLLPARRLIELERARREKAAARHHPAGARSRKLDTAPGARLRREAVALAGVGEEVETSPGRNVERRWRSGGREARLDPVLPRAARQRLVRCGRRRSC